MSTKLSALLADLEKAKNPTKGAFLAGFFKTGPGQYGEGDIFYGLTVPQSRKLASQYSDLEVNDIEKLIYNPIHEARLIGLIILCQQFKKADDKTQKQIFDFYLNHSKQVNNWDLVDSSADKIVGQYLKNKDRQILYKLATSDDLWQRRISIIATFAFIKDLVEFDDTFEIADILLQDKHDLIQKAVGWMLREVGKRISRPALESYLKTRYTSMPRTTLRYAIEHFSPDVRKKYLLGEI